MRADVAIAGAGFAGLGLAYYLRESGLGVVVADRIEPGSHRASACGMPEYIAKEIAPESILATQDIFYLETNRLRRSFRLPISYCTIDYSKFCTALLKKSGAKFLKTEITGGSKDGLDTAAGPIEADFVVDCTGWARKLSKGSPRPSRVLTAMEITVPIKKELEGKLSFYVDKSTVPGYGWVFPVGNGMGRVGAGGGCGSVPVSRYFTKFLEKIGVPFDRNELTGGGIPCSGLRKPYENGIYFVGDSASHVLPLTAEGIRPALYFARECASAISAAHSGKITRERAAEVYSEKSLREARAFSVLNTVQNGVLDLPQIFFDGLAWTCTIPPARRWIVDNYLAIARL